MKNTTKKKIITCTIIALFLTIYIQTFAPNVSASTETDWVVRPLNRVHSAATNTAPNGLSPAQVKMAYNLPSVGGSGTIAIVNAYDCPTVYDDLVTFSTYYGLLPLVFEKHMMASSIGTDSLWALETCIDTQWAHAIAPNAKILLVEAKSDKVPDILAAVDYARSRSDVVAISMSWAATEKSAQTAYNSYFSSATGAVFFAASGDEGAGAYWPASSSNVVAVGGTTLNLNSDGTVASETAWSGSGGGESAYENAPIYQTTYGISSTNGKRCIPDVSYVADPTTGVSVYTSATIMGQSGWFKLGGTSIGSPQWAAIHALGLTASNTNLYQNAKISYSSYFRDITSGTNGAYSATIAYDLVTGLGSPLTVNFAPVIAQPDFTITAASSALTITPGNSATTSITLTAVNGFNDVVSLTATPSNWITLTPATLKETGTSTLTINVPEGTQAGTYPITITGASDSLSHQLTITISISSEPLATKALSASVETNRPSYSKSSTVIVTIKVTDGTNPIKGALVTTIIYGPNNIPIWISIDTTNANGIDQLNYKITALNAKGTYRISVATIRAGYTMDTEQTTFKVV